MREKLEKISVRKMEEKQVQCVRKVAVHLGYGTVPYVDLVVSIEVGVEVC
jgi:hypothetical protein